MTASCRRRSPLATTAALVVAWYSTYRLLSGVLASTRAPGTGFEPSATVEGKVWYVSRSGLADDGVIHCGRSRDSPCRHLDRILHNAAPNDVIHIDDIGDVVGCENAERKANRADVLSSEPYRIDCRKQTTGRDVTDDEEFGLILRSVTIVADRGRPLISCVPTGNVTSTTPTPTGGASRQQRNGTETTGKSAAAPAENSSPPPPAPVRVVPAIRCSVLFEDSLFVNIRFELDDCNVVISRGKHKPLAHHLTEKNCRQRSDYDIPTAFGSLDATIVANNVTCLNVDVHLERVEVVIGSLAIRANNRTSLLVVDSRFTDDPEDNLNQFFGGIQMTVNSMAANIQVIRSTFSGQVYPTKVRSVVNLYDAALWIKAVPEPRSNESATNTHVLIDQCLFKNNERGLTTVGPYKNLTIVNSHFVGNRATHAGAGYLVLVRSNDPITISNCTFAKNAAGAYRSHYAGGVATNGTVKTFGNEVYLDTDCCRGVVVLAGKGGAIRIQRGTVHMYRSRFVGNTASQLGGSIFVEDNSSLNVFDTSFENVDVNDRSLVLPNDGNQPDAADAKSASSSSSAFGPLHAQQGDVIYSDGKLKINGVRLVARSAANGLSLFRHSGDHWSLEVKNISIRCPVGYNLRATNSTAYGVSQEGLRRSYFLDQLSYFCESCPRHRYSLDYGYLNYVIFYRDFVYFALLINGSQPSPAHTGTFDHHRIRCLDCPHGGQCDHEGITPVANYWGYIVDSSGNLIYRNGGGGGSRSGSSDSLADNRSTAVRFQLCPKGYCRSTGPALEIDSCTDRREGRLCGRCQKGYSEAWFSTVCVANDSCGPIWLYPLTVSLGLLYSVFLIYQADLKRFIFAGPSVSITFRRRLTGRNLPPPRQPACQSASGEISHEIDGQCRFPVEMDNFGRMHNHRKQDFSTGTHNVLNCRPQNDNGYEIAQILSATGAESTTANDMLSGSHKTRYIETAVDVKSGTSATNGRTDCQARSATATQEAEMTSSTKVTNIVINAVDSGCIVTLVYYLQDAALLRVITVFPYNETRIYYFARSLVAGLFRFEMDIVELLHRTCAVADMTPVPKLASQALLIPFVMLVFGLTWALNRISGLCAVDVSQSVTTAHSGSSDQSLSDEWRKQMANRGFARVGDAEPETDADRDFKEGPKNCTVSQVSQDKKATGSTRQSASSAGSLDEKLISGFISTLLFMYQKIGTTTFTLLNCVPIGDQQVLFVDGTISCYTTWQYAIALYAITCVTPFCLILAIGPELLRTGRLTLTEFFLGCLCPLPILSVCIYRRLRYGPPSSMNAQVSNLPPGGVGKQRESCRDFPEQCQQQHVRQLQQPLSPCVTAALKVLQGPFKENRYGVCWAGVMVGRRLVLILLYTFVNDVLLRLLAMLVFCFVVLLHHVDVQPYRDRAGNISGTFSAASLVILGTVNLVRAGFEAAEYTPSGPNATLMNMFWSIENMLMLWMPLAVVGLLSTTCVVRLFILLYRRISCGVAKDFH